MPLPSLVGLQGSGTIKYLPSLASLQSVPGVLAHLETKVSVHEARDFRMIDFIDTPGLVDGNVEYPFDVQKALLALAGVADVVLVFLDPMGQALCSRTMHAVRELEKRHASKMRYYLTKVDAVSNLNDLLKVSNQMIQNLSKYLSNTHGFQLSPIFLPPAASGVDPAVQRVNRIDELCDELSGAIPQKVQNNMHIAAQHASLVFGAAEQQLRSAQRRDTLRAYLGLLQLALGAALMAPLALLSAYHVLPLAVGTDPWTETVTVALDVAVDTGAAVLVYPLAGEVEGVRRRVLAWLIVLALLAVGPFPAARHRLHPPPDSRPRRSLAASPHGCIPHLGGSPAACLHCGTGRASSTLRGKVRCRSPTPPSCSCSLTGRRGVTDIYEQFFSDSLHMEGQAEEPAREEAAKGE